MLLVHMSLSRDYMDHSLGMPSSVSSDLGNIPEPAQRYVVPAHQADRLAETQLEPRDLGGSRQYKCPITHEALGVGDKVVELRCGHMFSPSAIRQWLSTQSGTCPVCRQAQPGAVPREPAVSSQPVAVANSTSYGPTRLPTPSNRVAQHRRDIENLARSILHLRDLQERRRSSRRANDLLNVIQQSVDELRDMGYAPSLELSTILPVAERPLYLPRYIVPGRAYEPGDYTSLTVQWQTEASNE